MKKKNPEIRLLHEQRYLFQASLLSQQPLGHVEGILLTIMVIVVIRITIIIIFLALTDLLLCAKCFACIILLNIPNHPRKDSILPWSKLKLREIKLFP